MAYISIKYRWGENATKWLDQPKLQTRLLQIQATSSNNQNASDVLFFKRVKLITYVADHPNQPSALIHRRCRVSKTGTDTTRQLEDLQTAGILQCTGAAQFTLGSPGTVQRVTIQDHTYTWVMHPDYLLPGAPPEMFTLIEGRNLSAERAAANRRPGFKRRDQYRRAVKQRARETAKARILGDGLRTEA